MEKVADEALDQCLRMFEDSFNERSDFMKRGIFQSLYIFVTYIISMFMVSSCGTSPIYMGGQTVTHDQSCAYGYVESSVSFKYIMNVINDIAVKKDYRQMPITEYYAGIVRNIEVAKTSPYRKLGENREYNIAKKEEIFNQWKALCETRNGIVLIKNRHFGDKIAGDTSSFSIQVCYSEERLSIAIWTMGGYGKGSMETANNILNEFKQDLLTGISKYSQAL